MRKKIIRFENDTPVKVKFSFNSPITVSGKFGSQFVYGVTQEGKDACFYATNYLHNLIQEIKGEDRIFGRILEIEKKSTSEAKNYWVIWENGVDITPKINSNAPRTDEQEKSPRLEKRVEELERRVFELESILGNSFE